MTAPEARDLIGKRVAIRTANCAVSGTVMSVTEDRVTLETRPLHPARHVPLAGIVSAKEYAA